MKKLKTLLLVASSGAVLTGCASMQEKYAKTGWWTPDSVNYTYATDKDLKPDSHYFGVGWSLK